jgi:hypothetical protein
MVSGLEDKLRLGCQGLQGKMLWLICLVINNENKGFITLITDQSSNFGKQVKPVKLVKLVFKVDFSCPVLSILSRCLVKTYFL